MHKFKNKIIDRINSHKYPVFIFTIISLIVPFLWFYNSNETFLSHGHSGLLGALYNPSYMLKFAPYLITSHDAGGPSIKYYIFYPFALIFSSIFNSFGHDYMYAEMFFLGITIFFSLIFFYLFVIELFENDNDKKFIAFISAIFYIFNIFTIFYLRYFGNSQAILYIFPLTSSVLYFFIKGLKTKKLYHSLIIALIFSLFVIILMLPQFYLPGLIFLIPFFFIYKIINNKNISDIKNDVVYILKIFFIVLLINGWWLIDYLRNFFATYESVKKSVAGSFMRAVWQNSPYLTAGNILSYLRNETFSNNLNFYPKYLHVMHENIYFTPYFILIGFFITFIAITPLLKNPKKYYIFVFLYLFGIYLSIGYAFPFPKLKFWFLENLPVNLIFQSNSPFLIIMIISTSILFGVGSIVIYGFIKNKFGSKSSIILLSFMMFISCIIYPFPLWYPNTIIGNMYIDYQGKKITTQIKIPYYYNYAKKLFDKTKIDYNILVLPLFFPNANFNWHYGYIGGMNFGLLYSHNIITPNLSYPQSIILVSMQNYGYPDLPILLGMLSTRYVILQNDIILPQINAIGNPIYAGLYHYLKYLSKRDLHGMLNTFKGIKFVKRYGKLDIYKLSNKYFLPRVWAPKKVTFVNNELKLHDFDSYIIPITLQNSFKVRTAVFSKLISQNQKLEKVKNNEWNNIINKYSRQYSLTEDTVVIPSSNKVLKISETAKKITIPTIEFKEINPSKYAVIVHNAKDSFPLIFNLMYLKGWNLYPQIYPIQNTDNNYHNADNISKSDNKNITFFGNKFISQKINGTIQNDNIPSGHIFQTLFQSPYPHKYHFIANGYANSWWINLKYIKKLGPQYYKVNKNGTYDFEFIIDYWPQRLLYIGIIISGTTVILFGLYLIYDAVKKRKTR